MKPQEEATRKLFWALFWGPIKGWILDLGAKIFGRRPR